MWSVRHKIIVVLAMVVGLYTMLAYTFECAVIAPSYESLQQDFANKEVQRCKSLIESELAAIGRTVRDWSAWDYTYAFVANGNAEYITSNLNQSSFESNKFNVIYVLDTNGKIVWGRVFDAEKKSFIELPEFSQDVIYKRSALYKHPSTDSQRSGIYVTERCPVLLSSCPIITSERQGPIRGSIIIGRFLDEQHVKELATAFNMDFTVTAQKGPVTSAAVEAKDSSAHEHDGKNLRMFSSMPDILGSSVITIMATAGTPIAAKGQETVWLMTVSTLAGSIIMLVLTYWLLKRTIFTRLAKVDECIAAVTATHNLSMRVEIGGADELSRVAGNLNSMLERLGKAESDISEGEKRFRSAFFNAPFPIMIYADDGSIMQVNRKWAHVTGYGLEDTPTIDAWSEKAYGSDVAGDRRLGEHRVLKDGLCTIHTKSGKSLIWEFTSAVLGSTSDGRQLTILTAIDITAREVAEKRMHDNESQFRYLSENIPAVTYIGKIDLEATIVYISPQVRNYFGFSAEEFVRMPRARKNVIHPDDYDRVIKEYYRACSERRAFSCDYKALGRGGNIVWVHEEAQVMETSNGLMALGVMFDISQSKAFELKIREANARLIEADRVKTEFLVSVSHELRTPLTIFQNVISNAVANVYGPLPTALKENIGMCKESVARLSTVVSNFLDMSRLETNKTQLTLERFDLNAICQQIIKSSGVAASAKGIMLRCYPTAEPVCVSAEKDRLIQAITNLVTNGIESVPGAVGRVELYVKPQQGMVMVEVCDNGKGMEPSEMDKLFKHTDAGPEGTDPGLAITKELIELHKGNIRVESAVGHGTKFFVSLPLADYMPASEQQEDTGKQSTACVHGS
jgi:PAS domain S-box-containing protein